jgi:hypothetical protein
MPEGYQGRLERAVPRQLQRLVGRQLSRSGGRLVPVTTAREDAESTRLTRVSVRGLDFEVCSCGARSQHPANTSYDKNRLKLFDRSSGNYLGVGVRRCASEPLELTAAKTVLRGTVSEDHEANVLPLPLGLDSAPGELRDISRDTGGSSGTASDRQCDEPREDSATRGQCSCCRPTDRASAAPASADRPRRSQ